MAYIDGAGHMRDGDGPSYDNMNGQIDDPPRLYRRVARYDVQYCPMGYWATREGQLIRIRAMSDKHLYNSMALLERKSKTRAFYEAWLAGKYAAKAPEHAGDAALEASKEMFDMAYDPDQDLKKLARLVWPKYKELELEWTRRVETLCQHP